MTEPSKYSIKTEVNQIIETNRGTIIGKQVQTQISPEMTNAIAQLQQLIEQFQQNHPTQQQTPEIIDVEFEEIKRNQPHQWQRVIDLLSVIFAGGVEAVKLAKPEIGIPAAVVIRLYEIYDRNRKQLPGN